MSTDSLSQLFTVESLLSLQGAAAAALLVPNALVYLIGDRFVPYAKWVSFGIAVVLAYTVAYMASDASPVKWVLAFFNAFLIFTSAVGINEAGTKIAERRVASGSVRQRLPVAWF